MHAGDVADETKRRRVPNGTHESVQSDRGEIGPERLRTNPVIAEEHQGLTPIFVADIDKFLCKRCDFPHLETLEIQEFFGWHSIRIIVVSLIDDVLRTEGIADLSLEFFQDIRGNRGGIAEPIDIFLPGELVEDERKLVKI